MASEAERRSLNRVVAERATAALVTRARHALSEAGKCRRAGRTDGEAIGAKALEKRQFDEIRLPH